MAGLRAIVAGFALNEKVSATPRSHMAQRRRRKLTSTEADHIGPGLYATTVNSPPSRSFTATSLSGYRLAVALGFYARGCAPGAPRTTSHHPPSSRMQRVMSGS